MRRRLSDRSLASHRPAAHVPRRRPRRRRIGLHEGAVPWRPMSYRLLCLDAGFTLLTPRRTLAESLSGVLTEDGRTITEDEVRAAWEKADRWFWDEYHRPANDTWSDDV